MKHNEILKAENITKEYEKGNVILDNINFTLHAGEFISIVGDSGCGKSTLLHVLSGIEQPTGGLVAINGEDINKMSDKKLSQMRREYFSFVYQKDNLIDTMTVLENIELPLVLSKRVQESKEKIKELMKFFEIEEKADKHPNELSGGEQQRVAIVRAMAINPQIIFLDEPTASLDKKRGEAVMRLLKEMNVKYGVAVVMVTHSDEQAKYAEKIIKVENGKITDVI